MDQSVSPRRTQVTKIVVISLLVFLVLTVYLTRDMDQFQTLIAKSGAYGILISLLLYALLGATVVPSEPLTMLNGVLFGPLLATAIAGTGNMLAALMEYYIGTRLANATSFSDKKEHMPFGLGKLPVDSALFLLLGRMVPGAGPKLISIMGGIYRVPLSRYLWTSAIPTYIGSALFAYGGFGLHSLNIVQYLRSLFH